MSGPGADRCNPATTGAPAAPGSKIRPSRATRWRVLVLLGLHGLFGLHLWHLYATGETISPLEPSEAMALATEAVINAGLIFFAATILATLVLGRFFCGWACHMVALQDLCLALLLKLGIRPRPFRSRALLIVPVLAALYMFIWPLAYRMWTQGGLEVHGIELYTSDFWATFPHPAVAVATFVVCGFVIVYFLGAKGFCTYACPYGAFFALADKVAPGRIRVDDSCDQCGHCTATCTSNVSVAQEVKDWGMVVDVGCMKCMDCVSVCPQGALSFGFGKPALLARPRAEPRPARPAHRGWEELLLVALFAAGFFAVRGLWVMDVQRMPFLFSLGVAGVLCGLFLPAVRLLTRPTVSLQQLVLKRDGRITRAGRRLLFALVPVAALWIHTGLVRWHEAQADDAMLAVEPWTHGWLEANRAATGPDFERQVAELASHADWLQRWALVEGGLNLQRRMWVALFRGELPSAQVLATQAREVAPGDAELVLLLGDLARARGDGPAAAGFYRTVHEARPERLDAVVKLAPILLAIGRQDEALGVLDVALVHHPENVDLALTHVSVLLVVGRAADAETRLRQTVASAPSRPEPAGMLASLLVELGRLDEAAQVLDEALERMPGEPQLTATREALLALPPHAPAGG